MIELFFAVLFTFIKIYAIIQLLGKLEFGESLRFQRFLIMMRVKGKV